MARNNKLLKKAKKSKNDEFYTQYSDIQKELEKYIEYNLDVFREKVVYCNCDDPYESNFFRYFVLNFKRIGLKQLITTSYKKINSKRFIINEVGYIDDELSLKDIALQLKQNKHNEWTPLDGDGDFRSDESISLLKQSDIVVTNPPFSLFREYIKQLVDYDKSFLIIGNINAIAYNYVFPLIKENKIWLGTGMGRWISGFIVPESYELYGTESRVDEEGNRIVSTNNCLWLTNLDHGKRHQPLSLMTMSDNIKFSSHKNIKGKEYKKYDNYDAIEVPFTNAIPSDYDGVMGVPITFLDKYSPEQFEIIWQASGNTRASAPKEILKRLKYMPHPEDRGGCSVVNGKRTYGRILIKHKIN